MNDLFNYTASTLTDSELKERIDNRQKYLPETVESSVAELQNRGNIFTDEELNVITADLNARRDNAGLAHTGTGFLSKGYKNNIVEDASAPSFYSRRALYMFTVLLGALFGSIMLAINLAKIKNRAGVAWVLLFGICFTGIQASIMNYANSGSSAGILFGLVAAVCIDYFFWDKFIGNSTFYRARPIWTPLIIAILLIGFVIWALMYTNQVG